MHVADMEKWEKLLNDRLDGLKGKPVSRIEVKVKLNLPRGSNEWIGEV